MNWLSSTIRNNNSFRSECNLLLLFLCCKQKEVLTLCFLDDALLLKTGNFDFAIDEELYACDAVTWVEDFAVEVGVDGM